MKDDTMNDTPYDRPEWLPPLSDHDQFEQDLARAIAETPKIVHKRAEVAYRCKNHGDLMAAVLRVNGRRYIVYRQHAVPETLPPEAEDLRRQLPPLSGMDYMQCNALDDSWMPDWQCNCGHAACYLTRSQVIADIERLVGAKNRVVYVEGNQLGPHDR